MLFICLDTCVWLGLLGIDFNNEDNYFEEICFWIEGSHLIHIAPQNIINEWNRNKTKGKDEAFNHIKNNEQTIFNKLKNDKTFRELFNPDKIAKIIQNRIDRIDLILNSSEKANHNDKILIEAANKNLQKQPPNHIKEGFKDTVNILTLINYLNIKNYNKCIFSTVDGDFSIEKNQPYKLHPNLINEFKNVNLEYIYFGNKKNIDDQNMFGSHFIKELRKEEYGLPIFQDFLKEKKREENERILNEKKDINIAITANLDVDFLENVKHIDIALSKVKPTNFELELLKTLINSHDSYKQYFLRNIGNNGLV